MHNSLTRLRIYIEPRDAWIGVYVSEKAVYVCPVPFLVIRFARRARPQPAASKTQQTIDLILSGDIDPAGLDPFWAAAAGQRRREAGAAKH